MKDQPITDSNPAPAIITVAPNGAYKQKADHPALPVTIAEVAQAAEQAWQAGATMIHAHARDNQGRHSLDPELNQQVWDAIRERLDNKIVVQLTTEAAGIYQPEQQMQMVRQVKPEAVSLALRELIPDSSAEPEASRFFHWIAEQQIMPQYILYSEQELAWYKQLHSQGIIPDQPHQLLFVLGRYHSQQQSSPLDLEPFLTSDTHNLNWMVCAFGKQENLCARRALELGGDVRVGFENNLLNSQGVAALNNAELVQQVSDQACRLNRLLMTADQFRAKFKA
ncbi:3-keto-5-aminohexanoate cleavage protein [Amphritea balenae]|uniref:3-keto-5-aminohexanoate cleavage protein n=1 Tax=Amphritea balenae TaxID=452629 RepID=A0A3P1SR78_9GAMM|nr:3-keto-5-aminohexanoate cleavage protein [Amphritea balenae]RRC99658.1 3-keto-5-aminohexanoate cleavage protein [Amphritea balenae]